MSQSKLDILIVEDDLSFALELEILLEEMGYHALESIDNGEEAYEFIYENRPDLILMDIDLNGEMTGTELGQRILAFEIPIIYITSFQNEKVFKDAQQSKMIAYLVKPMSKYSLQAAIANALEGAYKKMQADAVDENNLFLKKHLFIKREGIYEKIYIPDIKYAHSSNNYCSIYTNSNQPYSLRMSLTMLERNLPRTDFMRIHRQWIVQLHQITGIDFRSNVLYVDGNTEPIPISRSKRPALEELMQRLN